MTPQEMQRWRRTQRQLLEAVAALTERTPSSIQWDSLAFLKADRLTVKGLSTEMPKVFDMVNELKRLPLFADIEVKQATKRRVGDKDITEFEIVCVFAPLDTEAPHAEAAPARS